MNGDRRPRRAAGKNPRRLRKAATHAGTFSLSRRSRLTAEVVLLPLPMIDRIRARSFRRAATLAGAAILIAQLLGPATASAGSYHGSGDTGWTEDNQRDCCADAVSLAQDDSANMCRTAGGEPRINRDFDRGLCNWDAQGDGDDTVYRCTANADVDCW
jgi:hypothetical protein